MYMHVSVCTCAGCCTTVCICTIYIYIYIYIYICIYRYRYIYIYNIYVYIDRYIRIAYGRVGCGKQGSGDLVEMFLRSNQSRERPADNVITMDQPRDDISSRDGQRATSLAAGHVTCDVS
jgi:hypothetical protein